MQERLLCHQPVLLKEILDALAIHPDGHYVDATFGCGGHAAAILGKLGPAGSLLALDRDPAAGELAKSEFNDMRFKFIHTRFSRLAETISNHGLCGRINGVLLDLGVSSPQLDNPARGFSFTRDGILDMRMDPTSGESAADWISRIDESELGRVLVEFGEERFHRRIARAVVEARKHAPITTTARLAKIVSSVVPYHTPGRHPATRVFQAIRIVVNEELSELSKVLPQTIQVLATGGRLAVISFHSLEDRLVKQFMRNQSKGPQLPFDLPIIDIPIVRSLKIVDRLVRPANSEVLDNIRARSAILRVSERVL